MRALFLILFFSCFSLAEVNLNLALEHHREYIGNWRINLAAVDGQEVKISGYLNFDAKGFYNGRFSCHSFFGTYKVMDQKLLTLIPAQGREHSCSEKQSRIETNILRHFLGSFTLLLAYDRYHRPIQNKIILQSTRLTLWLSQRPRSEF